MSRYTAIWLSKVTFDTTVWLAGIVTFVVQILQCLVSCSLFGYMYCTWFLRSYSIRVAMVKITDLGFSQTIFTANLLGITWIVSKIIKHLLFSWFWSVWPWMKVKVNIINSHNMWCILVTEAVIFAKFDDDDFNSFLLNRLRGTHTHTHTDTDRQGLVYRKLLQCCLRHAKSNT